MSEEFKAFNEATKKAEAALDPLKDLFAQQGQPRELAAALPLIPSAVDENLASEFYKRLTQWIQDFDAILDEEYEVGVRGWYERYRIRFTPTQAQAKLSRFFGAARFAYNFALAFICHRILDQALEVSIGRRLIGHGHRQVVFLVFEHRPKPDQFVERDALAAPDAFWA
jgi:hypothetical protein